MRCSCQPKGEQYVAEDVRSLILQTFSAEQATDLFEATRQSLTLRASSSAGGQVANLSAGSVPTQFHVTSDGDVLATSSFARDNEGTIVLRGSIAGIPYELHVTVALDDAILSLTLEFKKPIQLGPFTLKFKLGGVTRNDNNEIVGATTIAPDFDLDAFDTSGQNLAAFGFGWVLCVLKCGGAVFLPILVACLPSIFAGGPAAFIACVVAKAGGGAAGVAACVAQKCIK